MRTLDRTSIFDSPSQLLDHINPTEVRPIGDRLLIRDVHDDEKIGSILMPERSDHFIDSTKDRHREGIVVAIGQGDRWLEVWHQWNEVSGKEHSYMRTKKVSTPNGRLATECKVGDRVIVDRRRDEEIYISGERYYLCHEEQAILGIIEN
jgi:co-chaperonin GroES (HSP10)